jgi:hypothetical protein
LEVLLAWAKEEILPKFEESPVPVAVLAMKLLSRWETEPQLPLAWPLGGISVPRAMRENGPQIRTAVEELLRLGHVYFPHLSFNKSECEELRDSIVVG